MPFAYKTKAGQPAPAFSGISTDADFLWDAGELGSRDKPTLNYEFNKKLRVKVK